MNHMKFLEIMQNQPIIHNDRLLFQWCPGHTIYGEDAVPIHFYYDNAMGDLYEEIILETIQKAMVANDMKDVNMDY